MNAHIYGTGVADFIINYDHHARQDAYDQRITCLVMHYTALDFRASLHALTGQDPSHKVSAHYLVADKLTAEAKNYIYPLVDENKRAWHAGLGQWGQFRDLNTVSIGIEIVNLDGNQYPYPDEQIEAVTRLSKYVIDKYQIRPENVIGHSDLAPTRREDPGILFPWQKLYENGIGAWPDKDDIEEYIDAVIPDTVTLQAQLSSYGYGLLGTMPEIGDTFDVIKALQRHFRAENVDGVVDHETYAILRALLKKYKNQP